MTVEPQAEDQESSQSPEKEPWFPHKAKQQDIITVNYPGNKDDLVSVAKHQTRAAADAGKTVASLCPVELCAGR